jgi:hypothetical protein
LNQERLLPFSAILGIFGASAISFSNPLLRIHYSRRVS